MKLSIRTEGEFTIATIEEARMDAAVAPELKNHIAQLLTDGKTRIVLDISAVTFMDSSSLGALVSLLKMVGNRGDLVIAGAKGIVADLFKLTRMDRVFRMAADVDAALGMVAA
ncbi:MAG TPA: STAS domain-containing protein [Candidatus Thiothrix moscowensis]|uniref:STAS domain-containing protein n=1 Tax=unclassified Thiothrix TaxID=2636184 RepID=UPI001A2991EA|nr:MULTISPECIES: STAS domain-containing protein [unclassified Thiothrix]MBJ6609337.1 STAS domain-containing protein [Candidatus Thiothrix moscowensis]HRJ51735.1 STAS domain-containing protein [Candidatus Thiothrix moscowensis]HRJ92050.1 STAS domain-containing protein [Candidatus Thiothrix moscowensis]